MLCVYWREDSNLHGFPLDTKYNLDNTLFDEVKKVLLVDFDPQGNLSMYFGIEQRDQLP
ncbi:MULTISPECIES: ParA family protein [Paenibacillus]|uniref:ParA family protein n=1 Tax=Paenibacillus TaxID=44249 RepID=UPI00215A6E73|nr:MULTISPECIES: AAA family ATPase [Paenibacillus]